MLCKPYYFSSTANKVKAQSWGFVFLCPHPLFFLHKWCIFEMIVKYHRYSRTSAAQQFLSSCFSEVHIKFDCSFPLYFLPLNIVNQTVNTFKTYQFFESFWRLPAVLSEFLSFSASRMTSVLSSNGQVQCAACQLFLNTVACSELQHSYIILFLIAGNVRVFLNEFCNHNSCTGRINTNYGTP